MKRDQTVAVAVAGVIVVALAVGAWLLNLRGTAPPVAGKPGAHAAIRAVSLAPNLTEMAFAVGAGGDIVGVTDYDNYPPEVLDLPRVGGFINPSMEKIVAMKPDVVLIHKGNPLDVADKLRAAGVRVEVFDDERSLTDILTSIRRLGGLFGKRPDAEREAERIRADLTTTRVAADRARGARGRVRVYFGGTSPPYWTAGGRTFIDEVIQVAGGVNVGYKLTQDWPTISPEAIVAFHPQAIIVPVKDLKAKGESALAKARLDISQAPGLKDTDAAKNSRIILVDEDVIERPGPRIARAARTIEEALAKMFSPAKPPEGAKEAK